MEVAKRGGKWGTSIIVNMHISGKKQHLIISDTIFGCVTVPFFPPSLGISKGNGRSSEVEKNYETPGLSWNSNSV